MEVTPYQASVNNLIETARRNQERLILENAGEHFKRTEAEEESEQGPSFQARTYAQAAALGHLMIGMADKPKKFSDKPGVEIQKVPFRYHDCLPMYYTRLYTPLLLRTKPEDVDPEAGVRAAHGYRFVARSLDNLNESARFYRSKLVLAPRRSGIIFPTLVSLTMLEIAKDTENNNEDVVSKSVFGFLRFDRTYDRREPIPIPPVNDPNSGAYVVQRGLLQGARLELGDKASASVLE